MLEIHHFLCNSTYALNILLINSMCCSSLGCPLVVGLPHNLLLLISWFHPIHIPLRYDDIVQTNA